jgi:hypothetical protein
MPANISVAGDTSVHGGAPFDSGLSTTVLAGNKGVALAGQTGSGSNDDQYNSRFNPIHSSGNQTASGGSSTVFANGKPVHRVGDARIEGSTSGPGVSSVQVG